MCAQLLPCRTAPENGVALGLVLGLVLGHQQNHNVFRKQLVQVWQGMQTSARRWTRWPRESSQGGVLQQPEGPSGRLGLQMLEQKSCFPVSPPSEGFGFVAELLLLNLLFHPGGVLIDNCLLFQILLA